MVRIKMEVNLDFLEPATPSLTHNNASFWRSEDSGYHTSFTPGSVECSEISNENLEPSTSKGRICLSGQAQVNYDKTPEATFHLGRKYGRSKNAIFVSQYESPNQSPIARRGVKRPYLDDAVEVTQGSIPTPTSMIAGGIQKLKVTADNMAISWSTISSNHSSTLTSELYLNEYVNALSYPTTPVKKICRTSCKLSPMKRSTKKLNFAIHSLSCESNGLVKKHSRPHSKVVRTIQFRPDQKIDIMRMLYESARVMPPILKIFSFLSHEDIYNFSLVSSLWCQIWNQVSKQTKKQDYENFLKSARENQENKNKDQTPKKGDNIQMRSLKEVHNVLNAHVACSSPRSPPGTPRTNKFRKFTKSASLDSRLQLSCVRCNQPSKVTEESTGEEWAECTSSTCSYQFCRHCKCQRHPGKHCFQYDLNRPSPSKRKKNMCAVGTKNSKRNLRRLL